MKLDRFDFKTYKNEIHIIPTIRLFFNDFMYLNKSLSVELHFMIWHCRWLFFMD